MAEGNFKIKLILIAFVLFSATILGLLWLATGTTKTVTFALSYAAGLSMIFLPCTLPLVFLIVPLSMGHGYKKGLLMAALFGLGLTVTLGFYGVSIALVGKWLGMDQATRLMFQVAGIAAFIFGLTQLKLLSIQLPEISGMPSFIQNRGAYMKSFLMGLFLGNAGVGCPNPAFYVLLAFIATTGDIFYGGTLGLVHGLGRATPLILISILAILGLNATGFIEKKRIAVDRVMGWALVVVGAFIFVYGFFGMYWWEMSPIHIGWNNFVAEVAPGFEETEEAARVFGIEVKPSILERYVPWLPWIVIFLFIAIVILWDNIKRRQANEQAA